MKKLLGILVLGFLVITAPSYADDIRDFQIEGMSIGDSLLDYMSTKKIKEEFEKTKNHYNFLKEPHKFREAYIFEDANFKTYSTISFYVKPDDKNYTIFFIRGIEPYINNMDKCLQKRNEIANEVENIISKFKKRESNIKSTLDKSGKSYYKQLIYSFKTGDEINISCNDWEEKLRIKNNWTEGLNVAVMKKDISDWFDNRK